MRRSNPLWLGLLVVAACNQPRSLSRHFPTAIHPCADIAERAARIQSAERQAKVRAALLQGAGVVRSTEGQDSGVDVIDAELGKLTQDWVERSQALCRGDDDEAAALRDARRACHEAVLPRIAAVWASLEVADRTVSRRAFSAVAFVRAKLDKCALDDAEQIYLADAGANRTVVADAEQSNAEAELALIVEDKERAAVALKRAAEATERAGLARLAIETQLNQAWLSFEQEQYDQAHEHYQRVLAQSLAASLKRFQARATKGLALVQRERRRHGDALELFELALALDREINREAPFLIAATLNNIGSVLNKKGAYREALAKHKEALAIYREAYGSKHPATARTLVLVGVVWRKLAEYPTALRHYELALAIQRKTLGQEHAAVGSTLTTMATTHLHLGAHREALRLLEQALVIKRKAFGEDDSRLAVTLNNIGGAHSKLGAYPQALEYYQRALALARKAHGDKSARVAVTLANIGLVYKRQGKLDKALEIYEQALAVHKSVDGDEPRPGTGIALNNIGGVYKALGKFDKAHAAFDQALELLRKSVGPSHHFVGTTLANKASAFEKQGKCAEAMQLYNQALATKLPARSRRTVKRNMASCDAD